MKFSQYLKPISISLSPNTEKDDIQLDFRLIFQPGKWKKGKEIKKIEEEFKNYLGVKYAISFNSGRSALMAILNSLELEKDSPSFAKASEDKEVLLQAFTCNAAVNPILWTRLRQGYGGQDSLKPVYVDCDEKTFNIDVEDLKRKIGPKSRVLMVQYTFGLPAEMDKILEICQKNNLILIEDCAHALGAEYGSTSSPQVKSEKVSLPTDLSAEARRAEAEASAKVGTFGKAAFFSFSRDKVMSSVYGGMATTNDDELAKKIRDYQEKIGYPSYFWIFQQLLHPVLMNCLILPTYGILGKYLLVIFQWLQILSKAVHWKEKRGKKPSYFPKRLPNALACLALHQFKKLEKFNQHRQEIANFYLNELKNSPFELPPNTKDSPFKTAFLRFTIKHPRAHKIIEKAWQKNLLIGDWYANPIAPHDTKLDKMGYKLGSCPKAEKLAKITLNLPTHINISEKEARIIVDFLKIDAVNL